MACLITTTKGLMDPEELEMREGVFEDDNERTAWVEYWDEGELVHRSVHVQVKKWPELGELLAQQF
jgi:hypothetical protein